jgi:hypothetical protein
MGTVAMTHLYTGLRRRKWWHVLQVAGDYTVDEDTEFLSVDGDATGGSEISLEAVSGVPGKALIVYAEILATGNSITLTPATGDTISGASSLTLSTQGGFVHLLADGATNWILYIDGR